MSAAQTHTSKYDIVIVGAGFAGLYALYRFRNEGYRVKVIEAGNGVGGTWFWNRYPGARCDVESMQYSYSFSDEVQQEWSWSERYAPQGEILEYVNFVADKFDLKKDIQFNTRVNTAVFDEAAGLWEIGCETGETFVAKYCLMATGCLSVPMSPKLDGIERFKGELYRTSSWPDKPVSFEGKRVGLIGTGSSGIQATPRLAAAADHLYVFQRTPNYSIPAHNHELDDEYQHDWKSHYPERRALAKQTRNNTLNAAGEGPGEGLSWDEREAVFEERWQFGGIGFMYGFTDMTSSKVVNDHASDFVRRKIDQIVKDPETAAKLKPMHYPIGAKRICVDTDYYKTFNRENVTLLDVKADPIETVTEAGVKLASGEIEVDILILATGFDAMTGALTRINPVGRGGQTLTERWEDGPKTYLGMAIDGFPNMFIVTGPGSPSVFTNMVTSVEQNVDWVADCMNRLETEGVQTIEATTEAVDDWTVKVGELAENTLLTGLGSNSWYVGANIEGKPKVFMAYLGGAATYSDICKSVADDGYAGFRLVSPADA